ncbi:MAG: hypothetical protein QXF78_06555 [Pyrobaculum sp.]
MGRFEIFLESYRGNCSTSQHTSRLSLVVEIIHLEKVVFRPHLQKVLQCIDRGLCHLKFSTMWRSRVSGSSFRAEV